MNDAIDCLVLHHNDLDGKSSAALVDFFEVRDCTFYSINYGYDIPWGLIRRATKIYMVDFALQPFKEMIKIKEMKGDSFIWIDHHKTSLADEVASGQKFNGIREIGLAGCELVWKWFAKDNGEPQPKIITMLGRYDIWDLSIGGDLFAIQNGLVLYDTDPDNRSLWHNLFDENEELYNNILGSGRVCLAYQSKKNEAYCKGHSFDLVWEGYRFIVLNALSTNSKIFDAKFNHNDYDAMLCFGYTNRNWSISMYTDKPGIDVGTLARKMGGGGHTGASGFQCTTLPFELEMKRGS